jgi:sugar lactone lactonase YvrE
MCGIRRRANRSGSKSERYYGPFCAGAGHRVVVISPAGTMVGAISNGIPSQAFPTNVAFGGDDHRRLYITTRGAGADGAGVYYVDLNLPGMPY